MTSSCITIGEGTGVYHLPASFSLESRADLCGSHLAFELVGPDSAPVVLVQGGISSGRCVVSNDDGDGWWDQMVGDGAAVDSARVTVVWVRSVTRLSPSGVLTTAASCAVHCSTAALRRGSRTCFTPVPRSLPVAA